MTSLQVLRDRILKEFVPEFCNHPSRSYGIDSFMPDWSGINEVDATDFLRCMDAGLLTRLDGDGGQYLLPRSTKFRLFGSRSTTPRQVKLEMESVITVAVLARLHFDLGWPKKALGTESKGDFAFDAATYLSDQLDMYIACEVKKSVAELDKLLSLMKWLGKNPHERAPEKNDPKRNPFNKVKALRSRRPPLFWAVGPGGTNHAFRIGYGEDDVITFHEVATRELGYPLDETARLD